VLPPWQTSCNLTGYGRVQQAARRPRCSAVADILYRTRSHVGGAGYSLRGALAVAVALAQIGEFSFILATLGPELGLLTASAVNTLVAAALVSITLNPLLYRWVDAVAIRAARQPRLSRWRRARAQTPGAAEVGGLLPVLQPCAARMCIV
jgi:Kef-type K+ transport system membrane component KefB